MYLLCKINKTARNYVTNEVMESIFLKDAQDDSLAKQYNDADWVLRRRLLGNSDFPMALDRFMTQKEAVWGVGGSEILFAVRFE
uniref:Uncharacterized protein n=1 Tax=Ditylenchus dipsaci TaxID=166011 RepID=A0A915CZC6_9BILA